MTKNDNRFRKYNITADDFDGLVWAQSGCCSICGVLLGKDLCIDHDHNTGFVRGLLCTQCNFGLGSFKDSVDNLARAIVYLEKAQVAYQLSLQQKQGKETARRILEF